MNTLAQLKAGQLAGITRLDLSCGLAEFPQEIFELADSLEILNLSGNALSSLPDDLHRLPHLRVLFCSDNLFTELPACLGECTRLSMIGFKANQIRHVPAAALPPLLRWLILTDNQISELPDELGERPLLQKLMLAGNRLTHLPESLTHCHNLELLRIASNRFTQLPELLLALPSLTWLAYAGNPVEMAMEVAGDDATPHIPGPNWNWPKSSAKALPALSAKRCGSRQANPSRSNSIKAPSPATAHRCTKCRPALLPGCTPT